MSVPKSHLKLFWPSFFITPHFNDTQQIRCATFCYLLTVSEILLHSVDSSAHSTKNDVRLAGFIPHPSLGHCLDSSPMSTKDLSDSLAIIPIHYNLQEVRFKWQGGILCVWSRSPPFNCPLDIYYYHLSITSDLARFLLSCF